MIAKLHGKIDEIKPTEVILDVNGVGYLLEIPITTFEEISSEQTVSLYVYTLHKEDQFRLFGFKDEQDKKLFTMLLSISGIGPAMALSILSGMEYNMLFDAIQNENITLLTKIPGIGKAKAEKLIFELKRKLKTLGQFTDGIHPQSNSKNDAIHALVSLGFDEKKSFETINAIVAENPQMTLEETVKEGLRLLSQ